LLLVAVALPGLACEAADRVPPTGNATADAAPTTGPSNSAPPDASPAPSRPMSPATAGTCPLTQPGATGREPEGSIPVCCLPSASEKAAINEVFRLLNQHREQNGRAPLVYDDALEQAIQGHCRHMATHTFFDHSAPEAPVASFSTRAKLCGASASGENIAYNQRDAAEVMKTWTESAGHNQNMLSANYRRVGICFHDRRWGQIFGR
jgi:uncharacterized protein YkwD